MLLSLNNHGTNRNPIPTSTNKNIEKLKKKADKSGMPLAILKKVFQRGVAAWKTGHRPGTTAVQWGLARVNSFVTKYVVYATMCFLLLFTNFARFFFWFCV